MTYWGAAETEAHEVSLKDGIDVARIGADIFQLVTLDALWTAHATNSTPEDREKLGEVVDLMDAALSRLAEAAQKLLPRLQTLGEDGLEAAVSRMPVADEAMARGVRDRGSRDGGLLPMFEKGLGEVGQAFSEEGGQIRGEYDRICAGYESDGDMGHLTHCGVGLMEMGLGLAYGGLGASLFVDGAERVIEHCAEPG